MPEIRVLSQDTIDKIAAGEVVERPSSVVKELVENAIDARATAITVEIKEGGISFLRITDNGCGIERAQVPTAFLPHATSKIKDIEDLFTVQSLGFRGEALSSIAAVAQVELITKTYGELTGTRYVIEGSKEKENEEIGAPEGTTFIVRNLFYNTPARRKFLKSATTEGNYIGDLMERLALSHPAVSFKFINNGQTKLHTSGNANEKDMIYHIYGRDIAAGVLPVETKTEHITMHGFVGKPLISRGNRNLENYFINGRYIKSPLFAKAIEEAYKGFLMQHQYPFCLLYITMDSGLLDVNVHPNKMELRFSNAEQIYQDIYHAVREALAHREHIATVSVEEKKAEKAPVITEPVPEPFEKRRISDIQSSILKDSPYEPKYPQRDRLKDSHSVFSGLTKSHSRPTSQAAEESSYRAVLSGDSTKDRQILQNADITEKGQAAPSSCLVAGRNDAKNPVTAQDSSAVPKVSSNSTETDVNHIDGAYEQQTLLDDKDTGFLTRDARRRHKIIGQLFDTYWMIEYEDKLFIIDQHAAHEKVLYEKTMKRLGEGSFTSQSVSPPIILSLSREEEEMFLRYREQITSFGYEIEHFGGREYALNALPAEFEDVDMKQMFVELLNDFSNLTGREAPELILEKVASMSCKAAVKGNQKLSLPEITKLMDELLELDNPYHCPHGRPTIISMTKYEIEKKFKRIL